MMRISREANQTTMTIKSVRLGGVANSSALAFLSTIVSIFEMHAYICADIQIHVFIRCVRALSISFVSKRRGVTPPIHIRLLMCINAGE